MCMYTPYVLVRICLILKIIIKRDLNYKTKWLPLNNPKLKALNIRLVGMVR